MKISIEQELASIVRFVEESTGGIEKIFERIPEDFPIPSVFFPVPELSARKVSMQTMRTTLTWYVKFFASNDMGAYTLASTVESLILYRNCQLPMYTESGELEEKTIPVSAPEVIRVDYGVYQIKISCERYTSIYRENGADINRINIDGPGFFNEAMEAYRNVIDQYASKKEVGKIGRENEQQFGTKESIETKDSVSEVSDEITAEELCETVRSDDEHI